MTLFTFALIKPDAVANPIVLKWISEAIVYNGLYVSKGCRIKLSRKQAECLYVKHEKKFFYNRLIQHVCSGPSIILKIEALKFKKTKENYLCKILRIGNFVNITKLNPQKLSSKDLIQRWRVLIGPSKLFLNLYKTTNSIEKSNFQNLRQYFALSDTRNMAHGSDSTDERNREYEIFKNLMHDINNLDLDLFQLNKFYLPKNKFFF